MLAAPPVCQWCKPDVLVRIKLASQDIVGRYHFTALLPILQSAYFELFESLYKGDFTFLKLAW